MIELDIGIKLHGIYPENLFTEPYFCGVINGCLYQEVYIMNTLKYIIKY